MTEKTEMIYDIIRTKVRQSNYRFVNVSYIIEQSGYYPKNELNELYRHKKIGIRDSIRLPVIELLT